MGFKAGGTFINSWVLIPGGWYFKPSSPSTSTDAFHVIGAQNILGGDNGSKSEGKKCESFFLWLPNLRAGSLSFNQRPGG